MAGRRLRAGAVMLGTVSVVAVVGGCSGSVDGKNVPRETMAAASAPTTSVAPSATATKGGGSVPVSLKIPSIGFDKKLTSLGLTEKGEISPPQGVTQWYDATVSPGTPGISVIAGHVTFKGPDVFARLEEVKVGDKLTVGYANGTTREFVVTREKSVDKQALRYDQSVWGTSKTPVLALITCDAASQLVGAHHVNNFVVWSKPVKGA